MEQYKDKIGQRCNGQTPSGNEVSGWYLGMNGNRYVITIDENNIGKNPLWGGSDCKTIEFIDTTPTTPEVFEHYGKEAWLWDDISDNKVKGTIVLTHTNGTCRAVVDLSFQDFIDSGRNLSSWRNYELIEDIDIVVTINGETKTIEESLDILNKLK